MQARLHFSVSHLPVPDTGKGSGSVVTKVKIRGQLQHFDLVCWAPTLHLPSPGSVFRPLPVIHPCLLTGWLSECPPDP